MDLTLGLCLRFFLPLYGSYGSLALESLKPESSEMQEPTTICRLTSTDGTCCFCGSMLDASSNGFCSTVKSSTAFPPIPALVDSLSSNASPHEIVEAVMLAPSLSDINCVVDVSNIEAVIRKSCDSAASCSTCDFLLM